MSYTVALTGGIGSGKSMVADCFSRFGICIIDADIIARQVVQPGKPALDAIVEHFGNNILQTDGSLNRRLLRKHIFSSPSQQQWLNALLHPLIHQQTLSELANGGSSPYLLWVVPLLLENKLQKHADRILVVDTTPEEQIVRTMRRDGVSRQLAEKILITQATREERLAIADDIISNDGSPEQLEEKVSRLHCQYLSLAAVNK